MYSLKNGKENTREIFKDYFYYSYFNKSIHLNQFISIVFVF